MLLMQLTVIKSLSLLPFPHPQRPRWQRLRSSNACVLAVEIHSRFALLNKSLLLRNMDIYISRFFVYLKLKFAMMKVLQKLLYEEKGRFRGFGFRLNYWSDSSSIRVVISLKIHNGKFHCVYFNRP